MSVSGVAVEDLVHRPFASLTQLVAGQVSMHKPVHVSIGENHAHAAKVVATTPQVGGTALTATAAAVAPTTTAAVVPPAVTLTNAATTVATAPTAPAADPWRLAAVFQSVLEEPSVPISTPPAAAVAAAHAMAAPTINAATPQGGLMPAALNVAAPTTAVTIMAATAMVVESKLPVRRMGGLQKKRYSILDEL